MIPPARESALSLLLTRPPLADTVPVSSLTRPLQKLSSPWCSKPPSILMSETFVNINLLPPEFIKAKELRENRPYLYFSLLMAILLVLTPFVFLRQENILSQSVLQKINFSLQEYEKYKPRIKKSKEEINDLKGKKRDLTMLVGRRSIWLARLLEVGGTLPSRRIYLTNFSPLTGCLEIKGEISFMTIESAFKDLRNFALRLNKLEYLEGASVSQCDRDKAKKKLVFTVTVKIKE